MDPQTHSISIENTPFKILEESKYVQLIICKDIVDSLELPYEPLSLAMLLKFHMAKNNLNLNQAQKLTGLNERTLKEIYTGQKKSLYKRTILKLVKSFGNGFAKGLEKINIFNLKE